MFKGFKNFLMRGNLVIVAVGLVVALGFSTLIAAFTTDVVSPLINSLAGDSSTGPGLGWTLNGQFIALGKFIGALVYFVIFMAVVYFVLVVPYRSYMAKLGTPVFTVAEPAAPTKTCPECLSADLPMAATRCSHCTIVLPTDHAS